MTQTPLHIGVIGLGSAGMLHARALSGGEVPGAVLTAVVSQPVRFRDHAPQLAPQTHLYESLDSLLAEGHCDAVIIASPHPQHREQAVQALQAGCHVFCEKPAALRSREAREMAETALKHERIYTLNYNRRVVPLYRRLRELVQNGAVGAVRRVNWTSTSWLRVQSYYDSSPWRGTWAGEGGGLLVNQWPHMLDLWHWIFGTPTRLQAHCRFGAHHHFDVEDEVHVFAEHAGGASVYLTGSTGEAPGSERIEIVGDRGSIIAEDNRLTITRLQMPVQEFIATAPAGFSRPDTRTSVEAFDSEGDLAAGITKNFVAAIQQGDSGLLIAPGADGVAGVMLANAILLSGWDDGAWVSLPLDRAEEARFERLLAEKIAASRSRDVAHGTVFSLQDSFRRR